MQARFLSASILVLTLAAAAPAAALVPEIPICGHCTADVGAGNGGIWKTTDGGAPSEETSPDQVQTAPSATVPVFLELGGIPGESSETPRSPPPPPPPPPPQNAPAAEAGVQSQGGQTSALIVPAVQRVRDAAARQGAAEDDGVTPEMPICGHCGADAPRPTTTAAQEPQRERRGGFSVSFGGITVGSGGVSVAAGDVNGDGRGETRSRPERRSDGRR